MYTENSVVSSIEVYGPQVNVFRVSRMSRIRSQPNGHWRGGVQPSPPSEGSRGNYMNLLFEHTNILLNKCQIFVQYNSPR